jgi:hypothetical protein
VFFITTFQQTKQTLKNPKKCFAAMLTEINDVIVRDGFSQLEKKIKELSVFGSIVAF